MWCGGFPNSDSHMQCLLCLGEGHIKGRCSICKFFKKRTHVARDLSLKQHLLEQARRPTEAPEERPAPQPSSEHQCANVPRQDSEVTSSKKRDCSSSSCPPRKSTHKWEHSHSRSQRKLSSSTGISANWHHGWSGTHEKAGPSTRSLVLRQYWKAVLPTLVPCVSLVPTTSAPMATTTRAYQSTSDLLCLLISDQYWPVLWHQQCQYRLWCQDQYQLQCWLPLQS